MGLLWWVREGGADICHVPFLVAMKAKSLLEVLLLLFQGQLLWEDGWVYVYGIGVFGGFWGGEGLESLGWPSTLLDDLFSPIPLVLEISGFYVPVVDFVWDGTYLGIWFTSLVGWEFLQQRSWLGHCGPWCWHRWHFFGKLRYSSQVRGRTSHFSWSCGEWTVRKWHSSSILVFECCLELL